MCGKKIIKRAIFIVFICISLIFICKNRIYASELDYIAPKSVTYTFTNVPAGMPSTLTVDNDTLNAFALNPPLATSFANALSLQYSPNNAKIDASQESTYLIGVATGLNPGGIRVPAYIPVPTVIAPATEKTDKTPKKTETKTENTKKKNAITVSGNGYVEVSISDQKLTVFNEDGTEAYTTSVVTGNASRGRDTPTGTFAVNGKQTNRTLRGRGYASFVHYWVPIHNNIGIHDANWRSEFGGEIYKTNGSHGCINVPPSEMPALYDILQKGMKVTVKS